MRSWLFGGLQAISQRFLYFGAGRGAQPEVQRAISRFRQLSEEERAKSSLWAWLLGPDGTPPYKMTRSDIQWADHPVDGKKCANCQRWYIHHATKTQICDKVAGVWPGEWWCEEWEPPAEPQVYRDYQRG